MRYERTPGEGPFFWRAVVEVGREGMEKGEMGTGLLDRRDRGNGDGEIFGLACIPEGTVETRGVCGEGLARGRL